MAKKQITQNEADRLIKTLSERFEKNIDWHKGIKWGDIQKKLEANPDKLWSLNQMEQTGGEPDVVQWNEKSTEYLFFDGSAESPKSRRSCCYDQKALNERKEHKPKTSAVLMAAEMGIELLTEDQYRYLQTLGAFDLKTSSWIITPPSIRSLGGALFCDRRYDQVFTYHNGAISYYAARGFRGCLKI